MRIRALFFGRLSESAAAAPVDVEIAAGATVADLKRWATRTYPAAAPQFSGCMVAVNERYAGDSQVLEPGDVLAFLPPVSGG